MESDLIITNAVIYSVNDNSEKYEAMAIKDGKIIAAGLIKEIDLHYSSENRMDAGGKFIYPGFIDPHCHFYGYGSSLMDADLRNTQSFEHVVEKLKMHAENNPDGWLTGRGWDQNDWEVKKWPDNALLDELFPDRPVLLVRIDGHAALANSVALEKAGVNKNTQIRGGEVMIKNGKPTGILLDNAVGLVRKQIPEYGEKEISRALIAAQENCFSVGLCSVHDCGLDANIIGIMDELHKLGSLRMNIYAMLNPGRDNFEKYMFNGIYRTEHLHVASIKLYADGALGSRGARLLEPYSDDTKNFGLFVESPEYLKEMAMLADSFGYQVNTHCIGDAANRMMLDIYAEILKKRNDKRWRLEHAQVIHPDDLKKFGEYSIIPSIQASHATSDMYWAGERLAGRIQYAYMYRSLLQQNGWLPNGSDFPIEDINPLLGFYAAVSRKDKTGWPEDGFQYEEALNRDQALRAMTIWAAKAAFEEDLRGSLEPGKMADFVITDKDIMTIPENEIPSVTVLNTFISGRMVYSKNP